jgi:peroxiredoxin
MILTRTNGIPKVDILNRASEIPVTLIVNGAGHIRSFYLRDFTPDELEQTFTKTINSIKMKKITINPKSVVTVMALTMVFALLSFRAADKQSYKIGDTVADFSLKDTVDGKTVSMANYPTARGYVVIFTCNHCPFAEEI